VPRLGERKGVEKQDHAKRGTARLRPQGLTKGVLGKIGQWRDKMRDAEKERASKGSVSGPCVTLSLCCYDPERDQKGKGETRDTITVQKTCNEKNGTIGIDGPRSIPEATVPQKLTKKKNP